MLSQPMQLYPEHQLVLDSLSKPRRHLDSLFKSNQRASIFYNLDMP